MPLTPRGPVLDHLSYSTIEKMACPKKFELQKVAKVESQPSMAGVGGKAAHSLTEEWDRQDCPDWSDEDWTGHAEMILGGEVADTQNSTGVPVEQWRVSGRESKAWPNKEDLSWWEHHLPLFGKAYAAWRTSHPHLTPWVTPDGEPARELALRVQLPGCESCPPLVGYVDVVMTDATRGGALVVLDLKFGSMMPEDLVQLATYAAMVETRYGPEYRPALGAIYSGRKGRLTPIFKDGAELMPLGHLPTSVISGRVADYWALISTGRYPARPGRHCSWCDVRSACVWAKGPQAWLYDSSHPFYRKETA
ncbi:PD-(D/E)XK nuclease family protein [Streptosporangium sp. NPDC020072]|uniref:RecB family exonuclease n=1 Tax=Streptosporangium sp. NPDC020072 TaxID=3154788 RepID=UPI0034176389